MPKKKNRGNGQGSAYKENGSWTAEITLGYDIDDDGHRKRKIARKKGFKSKKEALDYLPKLALNPKAIDKKITFKKIGELCIKETEKRGVSKSTLDCYKAGFKHFTDIHFFQFSEIGIDDLQECIDECPNGKRTRQNMKVICGLIYKYAIPRGYTSTNLAEFLRVTGEETQEKHPFTKNEIAIFKKNIGVVPYADYIYALCYLGFRPGEFLALTKDSYNEKEKAFTGGSKTDAGKDRIVTISPKIQTIIDDLIATTQDGYIFHRNGFRMNLKTFREKCFYPALEQMEIPNEDPKRTPHSCRHTFANLIKNIVAADKDKLELIGHSSEEMLRYYQSVDYEDLRKITDVI